MPTTLIIPGLNSSGEDHWQTWFEEKIPGTLRVIQKDWAQPDLPAWSTSVLKVINQAPGRLYLVAHSFGVLASVVAAYQAPERIAGAFLVAPADPEKFKVSHFIPRAELPFPSIVVGSTSDPWLRLSEAAEWADIWGADFVNLGDVGHVNPESGFGAWPEGLTLFEKLRWQAESRKKRAILEEGNDNQSNNLRTPRRAEPLKASISTQLHKEKSQKSSDILHIEYF